MREIRLYGSEGGGAAALPTPILRCRDAAVKEQVRWTQDRIHRQNVSFAVRYLQLPTCPNGRRGLSQNQMSKLQVPPLEKLGKGGTISDGRPLPDGQISGV